MAAFSIIPLGVQCPKLARSGKEPPHHFPILRVDQNEVKRRLAGHVASYGAHNGEYSY
jgi:hypothetical protein